MKRSEDDNVVTSLPSKWVGWLKPDLKFKKRGGSVLEGPLNYTSSLEKGFLFHFVLSEFEITETR